MKASLAVALDVPDSSSIRSIISSLPDEIGYYKIGLELFSSEGPAALTPVLDAGCNVFLDLKLHDIPRTVARTVRTLSSFGVRLMTIHAGGGVDMLTAAAEAAAEAGDKAPKLVAVTTLTSLDQSDLQRMGVSSPLKEYTLALGEMAINAGVDGLVCSPLEASSFRKLLGPDPILVTPGIRPSGSDVGDQKRIATPSMAVQTGASILVVGRPILQADDPGQAAREILEEMARA